MEFGPKRCIRIVLNIRSATRGHGAINNVHKWSNVQNSHQSFGANCSLQNTQQFVYKEGQARVTKASVTLVLDNSDKQQSPMGYEDYDEIMVTRQVVIGGRNKYLINGQSAQLNRVKDLFLSVQLDVNNPHFLIMQV